MLYQPKVFISHSAKEPEAAALCDAVASRLSQHGFEVLWDSTLQTSQAWRAVIDEWIWRCDAAVLVLSDSATQSRYVAYEAALLRQRWRYHFPLIPVWCPGITETVLAERMGTLQLGEIHTSVKCAGWPAAFDGIAQEILVLLAPVLARTQARHDVEEKLTNELNFGASTEKALATIAAKYGLPPFPAGAKDDLAAALARRLLDSDIPLGARRFGHLASGISTMKTAINEAARVPRIVNLVAPFCWVSPEAALRVAVLPTLPPGPSRAIVWSRSWLLSEKMYLYRAYCTRDRTRLKIATASDAAGGDATAILDHIRSVLALEVCHRRDEAAAKVATRIRSLAQQGVPVFLVTPARAMDGALLAEIFNRWPELCVFLYGDEIDPSRLREQFPDVMMLEPPLTAEDEDAARIGWADCMAEADPLTDLETGAAFL
jgi:hypothetical protein